MPVASYFKSDPGSDIFAACKRAVLFSDDPTVSEIPEVEPCCLSKDILLPFRYEAGGNQNYTSVDPKQILGTTMFPLDSSTSWAAIESGRYP